jgi:hypothetical protein
MNKERQESQETSLTVDHTVNRDDSRVSIYIVEKENEIHKTDSPVDESIATDLLTQKLHEWSVATSVHGYPNIFRTQISAVKLFWVVLLLFSLILCFVLVGKHISDYLAYETTSRIQVIYESSIDFPSIRYIQKNSFMKKSRVSTILIFTIFFSGFFFTNRINSMGY